MILTLLINETSLGVLALGSFSASDFNAFMDGLVVGLLSLRELGAQQLVVDVVRNHPLSSRKLLRYILRTLADK